MLRKTTRQKASVLDNLDHPSCAVAVVIVRLFVLLVVALAERKDVGTAGVVVTRSVARCADDHLVRAREGGRNFEYLLVRRDGERPDSAQDVVRQGGGRPAGEEGEGVDCETRTLVSVRKLER